MALENSRLIEAIEKLKDSESGSKEIMELIANTRLSFSEEDNFLLVYGSLRKGQFNYKRIRSSFGTDSFIYLSTTKLQYSVLHDLGNYSALLGASYLKEVVVEIMYCSDKVAKAIKDMELDAGYRKTTYNMFLTTELGSMRGVTFSYYIADRDLCKEVTDNPLIYPLVECGDWVKYLKSTQVAG